MSFTHLDDSGRARMVDVTAKSPTVRAATARGFVRCSPEVVANLRDHTVPNGDVLAVARIAGIMAAKRTSDLIPLCHPLPLTRVAIDLAPDAEGVTVTATAATEGKTGVEMEALTAASVALLTIYDMAKAIDKAMIITGVRLLEKRGGKSGEWVAPTG